MPSVKKSVMLSEQAQNYIKSRGYTKQGGDDLAWSEGVNETFKAARWVAEQSLPELDQDEWQTILNVYAGCLLDYNPPFRIASDMMDDVGAISLEALSPEYAALVKKVHALSQAEQFAILDFVRQFWSRDWSESPSWDAIYQEITGHE